MFRILPAPTVEVDTDDAYRDVGRRARTGRPWVLTNMIATADGAIEIGGLSGPLGSPGDKDVFGTLRTLPDVILVGSGTVTAEDYGPPATSVSSRARRLSTGAWPVARIAVVTASLGLDLGTPLFTSKGSKPIVITVDAAPADRLELASTVADVIVAGENRVDLAEALAQLGALGAEVVLSEGGPSLNGQLLAADVVDELCITVAPLAVAGESRRLAWGPEVAAPHPLVLAQVLTEDHSLFLRYLVDRDDHGDG